jgi:hypothetical protein
MPIKNTILSLTSTTNPTIFNFDDYLRNVVSIELIRSRMPSSEYTIEDSRNLYIFDGAGYILPNRDYNSGEFIAALQAQQPGLVISEVERRGVFMFSKSTAFTIAGGSMYQQLGLERDVTYTAVDDGAGSFIVIAPHRFDLSGTSIIYVYLDETAVNTRYSNEMYLGEIYLSSLGENLTEQTYDIPVRSFQPIQQLTKLTVRFYRDIDRQYLYQFRGIQWYIQLKIQYIDNGIDWTAGIVPTVSSPTTMIASSAPTRANIAYI